MKCAYPGCNIKLNRTNFSKYCYIHKKKKKAPEIHGAMHHVINNWEKIRKKSKLKKHKWSKFII